MAKENKTTITVEPGKLELFITREFEAPRELVFRAFTDPQLIVQWLGPRDLTMTVERFDYKNGGSYRYLHTRGVQEYWFHGVIHEALAPERIGPGPDDSTQRSPRATPEYRGGRLFWSHVKRRVCVIS